MCRKPILVFGLVATISGVSSAKISKSNPYDALIQSLRRKQASVSEPAKIAEIARQIDALVELGSPSRGGTDIRSCPLGKDLELENIEVHANTVFSCRKGAIVLSENALQIHNGAVVVLDSPSLRLKGNTALIDGSGADGRDGANGEDKWEWTSQGDADYWAARNSGNREAFGGDGANGEPGKNGAIVVLHADVPDGVTIRTHAGKGGAGGKGGNGRLLKNGRNNYCDGCTWRAPNGERGKDGARGLDGTYFVVR